MKDNLHDIEQQLLIQTNNNKKKTQKLLKKNIQHSAQLLELGIQRYMDVKKVSYEEAQTYMYSTLNGKPKSKHKSKHKPKHKPKHDQQSMVADGNIKVDYNA